MNKLRHHSVLHPIDLWMTEEEINQLMQEVQRLRVTTQRLEDRTARLENTNQVLIDQLRTIDQERRREIRKPGECRVGDRMRVLSPTCPGRNRDVIPSDGIGTITRVSGDWVYCTADSGVKTKRYPRNIEHL